MKFASVTGHRYIVDNSMNRKAVNHLINLAVESGIEKFLVGMSRGADFLFARVLSERKLSWIAVIPCTDQTCLWNENDRTRHKGLIDKADNVIILSNEYKHGVMHHRNEYMVDKSEMLLAIYDNSVSGGTAHTVNLALKKHKRVVQFNPKTYEFYAIKSRQLSLNLF
ncbi:SLOG family protein [Cyanobacterium aponinum]|uniref:DUF1273 domain-containing protein n=1 Tax=Cyanobacterium aponinum (strain PCC 10605) TaxID=755178 RepID=K9Z8U8_CYAAP|nr:SLOG family protein [Cyanobacterium aponinum]AFZ55584.1 hypothetical protein Cyan10605_3551 [Cyanobacterium aponinum PCC 10605]